MAFENKKRPFSVVFFIGLLSILYAEVYSGSSPLWFLTPWGWLVTFELYLAHLLFYVNIAIRKQRISLRQLYLLGCLVGLYEGPITKVLWHGYPNSEPASIVVLGFAFIEFLMLVFFWHPIFSFMMPIIVFELLSINYLHSNGFHSWLEETFFFTKPNFTKLFLLFVPFVGSIFLSVNSGFNIGVLLLSGVFNFLALIVLKNSLLKSGYLRGIYSFSLSDRWLKIVFFYLILLYVFMFFFIEYDLVPNDQTLALTALIYILILGLFLSTSQSKEPKLFHPPVLDYNEGIQLSWLVWLILILIFPLIPPVANVFLILTYFLLILMGVVFFLSTVIKVLIVD